METPLSRRAHNIHSTASVKFSVIASGWLGHSRAVIFQIAATVARLHENAGRANGVRHRDVRVTIADHHGGPEFRDRAPGPRFRADPAAVCGTCSRPP